jgi:hypothetical protein
MPSGPTGLKILSRYKKTAAAPAFLDYALLVVGVESEQDLQAKTRKPVAKKTQKNRDWGVRAA